MSKVTLLVSLFASFLLCHGEAFAQRAKFNWPELKLERTLYQLPADIKSVAPFNTDPWFSVKNSENREQSYLQTLYFLSQLTQTGDPSWFQDPIQGSQFLAQAIVRKKSKQVIADSKKLRDFTSDRKFWAPNRGLLEIEPKLKRRTRKLISKFKWVYDELEAAQESQQACHFHRSYDAFVEQFEAGVSKFEFLTQVLYAIDPPEGMSHFRACKIQLGLAFDLGSDRQDTAFKLEKFAMRMLLPKALASCKSEKEIDAVIKYLIARNDECQKIDATLEKAKWQFIANAIVLLRIRDKDYLRDSRVVGFESEASALMQSFRGGFYKVNHSAGSFADAIEARMDSKYEDVVQYDAAKKAELNESVDKLRAAVEKKDYRIVERVLPPILNAMTRAEFASELVYQANRYRSIETACSKGALERYAELKKLNDLWSMDSAWTKSPILNFIPCEDVRYLELRLRYMRRAAICLAVVTKWRLAHDGDPPADLKEAFEYAEAGAVPKDPIDESRELEVKNSKIATYISTVGVRKMGLSKMFVEYSD